MQSKYSLRFLHRTVTVEVRIKKAHKPVVYQHCHVVDVCTQIQTSVPWGHLSVGRGMPAITLRVPMNVCVDPAISSRLTRNPVKVTYIPK